LTSQYPLEHLYSSAGNPPPQLFSFDIVDWTYPTNRSGAAKSSIWRTKAPQHSHHKTSSPGRPGSTVVAGLPSSLGKVGGGLPPRVAQLSSPAITATVGVVSRFKGSPPSKLVDSRVHLEVDTIPLHVFLDAGSILSGNSAPVLDFVKDLAPPSSSRQQKQSHVDGSDSEDEEDEEATTPPATPHTQRASGLRLLERDREKERKRLEKLVLEDLDLSMDYRPEPTRKPAAAKVKNWRKVIFKPTRGEDTESHPRNRVC
jgi:autophagy-related protein 2